MDKYAHKSDCTIVRDDPRAPASAVLINCDGDVLQQFDEHWTDDDIWSALAFANRAYSVGVEVGAARKAAEIRDALHAACAS